MDNGFRRNVAFQNGRDGELFSTLDACILRQKTDNARLRVGE